MGVGQIYKIKYFIDKLIKLRKFFFVFFNFFVIKIFLILQVWILCIVNYVI